ncbi:sporulation protein YqfC [Clostridium sp. DL1XJH146]
MKNNKAVEEIARKLDIPKEIVMDLPKITITANREIFIENHKGIILFEEDMIKVNSNTGVIIINGNKLRIEYLEGKTIVVSGKFSSVIYEENIYE